MQITNHLAPEQQQIVITVTGPITQDNACSLIQYALTELENNAYREATLDLRGVSTLHPIALFRLHSLLQVFNELLLRRNIHLSILFNEEDREQWIFLDKAVNCEGINLKCFTNRQAIRQL